MSSRRMRLGVATVLLLALIGAAAWLGRPQPPDYGEVLRPLGVQGASALRAVGEIEEQGRRYRSVASASAAAGYDLATLAGREDDLTGLVVVDADDPIMLEGYMDPDRPAVLQFYGDVNFEQWPHTSPAVARSILSSDLGEEVVVGGHEGYLLMNAVPGGGESQLAWVVGDTFYRILADQRQPRELLLNAASSVTYP